MLVIQILRRGKALSLNSMEISQRLFKTKEAEGSMLGSKQPLSLIHFMSLNGPYLRGRVSCHQSLTGMRRRQEIWPG